jgi:hypothetical protein
MMKKRLGFAAVLLAGTLFAGAASASICEICVSVCVDKASGGQRCTDNCSPTLCPTGKSLSFDQARSLMVKEGSRCSVRSQGKSVSGRVHGRSCVLSGRL